MTMVLLDQNNHTGECIFLNNVHHASAGKCICVHSASKTRNPSKEPKSHIEQRELPVIN